MQTGRLTVRAIDLLSSRFRTGIKARLESGDDASSSAWTALACGCLTGIMVASVWLSWILTWGQDFPFQIAAGLMLCVGLAMGSRSRLPSSFGWLELSLAACCWTLLQPSLTICLVVPLRWISESATTGEFNRFVMGLLYAIPAWFATSLLWSSSARSANRQQSSTFTTRYSFGIAAGLCFNVYFMAPWIGTWNVVAIATAILVAATFLFRKQLLNHVAPEPGDGPVDDSVPANMPGTPVILGIQGLGILALGGLFAVVLRLVGQLMPEGFPYSAAEWIGVFLGYAIGQWSARGASDRIRGRSLLVPAASSALILAFFPWLVIIALTITSSVTMVAGLMAFRATLLAVATAPIGWAMARLLTCARTSPRSSDVPQGNLWLLSLFVVGIAIFEAGIEAVGLPGLLTVSCMALTGLAMASLALTRPALTRRGWCGVTACTLLACSVPLWRTHDDPARLTKLVFSTPAFVAHRAGWDSRLLTMLDDARIIDQQNSLNGHWTLWRTRGAELHLRKNGIPREVISANADVHPQFAPAVLQAVLPLSIADNTQRILMLGAGGGVTIDTCLEFPVQQIDCVEQDVHLIGLLRGPVAQQTGRDPFQDERVKIISSSPTVSLMTNQNTYDVILSAPPSSATTDGISSFTAEFYKNAARHLSDRGLFCQRFECIDYGPGPLRLVTSAMQTAFREVIAIETAAGEMLLLATKSEGVFIPLDLAARLEMPHVRRVLARSGLDWSMLLNFPAYDHRALGEITAGRWLTGESSGELLAVRGPLELMRWGPKLQEAQQVLTAVRTTTSPFASVAHDESNEAAEINVSRKSRMLEWLGDAYVSADVLRRLSDVAAQRKLVHDFPESELHWWEYRKAIRTQLQDNPRPPLKLVSHTDDESKMHPDDEWRKQYCVALGKALTSPTTEHVAAVEAFLQPYEPMISFFARQELAELLGKSHEDVTKELKFRLHVINFSPATDASTRNVASALDLLVRYPQAVPDPALRFDLMNGLVQTLRTRWETRQSFAVKSSRMQMSDVDRSVVAIEKAMEQMQSLRADAGISETDWQARREVIDRLLLRPLRTYRKQLQASMAQSESRTRELLQEDGKDGK